MISISDIFLDKLEMTEIGGSRRNGCAIACPGIVTGGQALTERELEEQQVLAGLRLSSALHDFYSQVKELEITWSIYESKDGKKTDNTAIFKNDEWLQANYYDQGYTWEAVSILLSGSLFIPTSKDLLSTVFAQSTAVYDKAAKFGLPEGSLRPIDTNEFATACVKIVDNKVEDRIYLYTGFGGMPENLLDMGIGFERYLELAYKAKCFNYWNLIYCLRDKVPQYELMRRYLPRLFPGVALDLTDFGM